MSEKKKTPDQKAKEAIMNLYQDLGKEPWLIAKVATPGILYGAFHSDGVNIYKFDKVQPILTQTHEWKNFTGASVDFFATKTVIALNGESHGANIVMMEKGKDLVSLLRSSTSITVQTIERPFWRKILGFRSKTKWKMAVAVVAYLAIFGGVVNAASGDPATTVPTTATTKAAEKTPEQITEAAKITDADKALLIKNQYKLFSEEEIKQFAEIEKKYNALADAEKAEVKVDYERLSAQKQYQAWIKSQFSVWDGANTYLVDLVKKNLNDPKSFDHEETTYKDMGDHLVVKMTYRAKNAFGALILQNVTAKTDYKTNEIIITSQNN